MCPKYFLLSPSQICCTSASPLTATTLLGDESEMRPLSPSVSQSENPNHTQLVVFSYFYRMADTEPEVGGSQSCRKRISKLNI